MPGSSATRNTPEAGKRARRRTAPGSAAGLRPFLKWAGGKRQLLRELSRFVPDSFSGYHEPFLGSGAMFFELWRSNRLGAAPCRLNDINADLVGCYRALAYDVEGVIRELQMLAARHAAEGAEAYYRVRDEIFNPRRQALTGSTSVTPYPVDLAAMFIYLNRTGYNGLFRLNGRGEFNVPAGRYVNPRICDEQTLQAVSAVLQNPVVSLEHDSFDSVQRTAGRGDFVYLDPPYAPLSSTARFTSYTAGSFSDDDQRRLREVVVALAERGCHVVLSNSTAPLVRDLYATREARNAGLRAHRVAARRAINSKAGRRGEIEEFIISNVRPTRG